MGNDPFFAQFQKRLLRELHLSRELLSNLTLEERAILGKDAIKVQLIQNQRIGIQASLTELQKEIPLERGSSKLLETSQLLELEILEQQILSIQKKIQRQLSQNQTLMISLSRGNHPQPIAAPAKKLKIETLERGSEQNLPDDFVA